MSRPKPQKTAVIFAGGVALGAYEAGAYSALHEHEELRPTWVAGSSIGAVNAALIAGCRSEDRLATLREFWQTDGIDLAPTFPSESLRNLNNWMSALQARLMGSPGFFRPKPAFSSQ